MLTVGQLKVELVSSRKLEIIRLYLYRLRAVSLFFCPVLRLKSRACAFSRVLFHVRRTKKKERLLVVQYFY